MKERARLLSCGHGHLFLHSLGAQVLGQGQLPACTVRSSMKGPGIVGELGHEFHSFSSKHSCGALDKPLGSGFEFQRYALHDLKEFTYSHRDLFLSPLTWEF